MAEAVALMCAAPADVAAVFCHMHLAGAAKGLLERHFNRFDLLFTNTLPSGLLLRKACWAAVGGYDESMRDGYEDWEFHLRLMRAGYRAIELPKPYYVYTLADEGMLLNRASRLHGRLWRVIRRKHADLYRPLLCCVSGGQPEMAVAASPCAKALLRCCLLQCCRMPCSAAWSPAGAAGRCSMATGQPIWRNRRKPGLPHNRILNPKA